MKRPHEWPCVCEDCCAPWDPNGDLADAAYVVRRSPQLAPVDQGMPLAEFCRQMMAIACKATGKTEAQLRAMGVELADEEKPMRKHWTEQYDREPGEEG